MNASAWYSLVKFQNGISGVVRSNYRTGGRVHQFELHGPGASAYINLGFGGAGVSAKILCGMSGHSISAAAMGEAEVIEFDGIQSTGSDCYARYYGYYDTDRLFVESALEADSPLARNNAAERMREDYETMELVQRLMDSRI